MLILPLHGTLDLHDGIAVVVFVLTLALGSLLASVRRRDLTPPPAGGTAPTAVGTRPRGEGEEVRDSGG